MTPNFPLARTTDPLTSKLSAAAIRAELKELHAWTVACVERTPGLTQRELGDMHCPGDLRKIGRRLNELEKLGLLWRGVKRRDAITGRQAETWWPVCWRDGQTLFPE